MNESHQHLLVFFSTIAVLFIYNHSGTRTAAKLGKRWKQLLRVFLKIETNKAFDLQLFDSYLRFKSLYKITSKSLKYPLNLKIKVFKNEKSY